MPGTRPFGAGRIRSSRSRCLSAWRYRPSSWWAVAEPTGSPGGLDAHQGPRAASGGLVGAGGERGPQPEVNVPVLSAERPAGTDRRRSRYRNGAVVVVVAVMLGAGLLLVALNAGDLGTEDAILGLLASTLPAPVLVGLVLTLDRLEPEPPRNLALTFLWGATVAALFATVVNTVGGNLVAGMFGHRAGNVFLVSVSAPVVEEVLKGLALLVLFRVARRELNGVVDGIIYASVVGLGFAVGENVHYYGRALASGDAVVTFLVRGILAPFAHPLFTVPIGIGLALAAGNRSRRSKAVPPLVGLLTAIAVHSAWNSTFLLTFPALVVVAVAVYVPAFVGVLITVRRGLDREGALVRAHLANEVEEGVLEPEELEALASVRGRRRVLRAGARSGRTGRRAARELCHAASELAFHRELAGGDSRPHDPAREARLVTRINDRKAKVGYLVQGEAR